MIIDELITLLGLEVDPKAKGEAEGFGKVLGGVTKMAVAAGAALAAFGATVSAYTASQAEAIDASGKFADSLGITYENLQQLEYAMQRQGGSVDELRGDLDKLTKTMASPVPGEFNQTLYQLGVATRNARGELKTADELLLDITGKFEGMSKQRQLQFAEKLGLSPGTIKLMQTGQAGIQDLRDEAVRLGLVLDESSKEKAARFQDSLLNSRSVVDALGKSIAVGLMPAMADSMDVFTDWIGANGEFISMGVTQIVEGVAMGFQLFGDAVGYAWDALMEFIGPVGDTISQLDATQAIAILVAGTLAALAAAAVAAAWPFIAAAAAIAAVVIVLEDLYAAFMGQESVIGGWANAFAEAYPGITGAISGVLDMLVALASFFTDVLVSAVSNSVDAVIAIFSTITGGIKDVMGAIEGIIAGADPFKILGDLFQRQVDRILGLGKSVAGAIGGFFGGIFGGGASASATAAPVPASVIQGGGGAVINNTVTNNINGAGNPSAVANEVMNRGGLGQTLQQYRPGMTGPVVG